MGHKKRKWKREWERETKIMQLKIRLTGTRKPQNRGQTSPETDRRMETATDQRSCHTKRHLPWSRCWDRIWTEKLHERKPKQLCVIELWFLLLRFCYRISFALRSFFSFSRSKEQSEQAIERSSSSSSSSRLGPQTKWSTFATDKQTAEQRDRWTDLRTDLRTDWRTDCNCPSAPYVWWVCGSVALAVAAQSALL